MQHPFYFYSDYSDNDQLFTLFSWLLIQTEASVEETNHFIESFVDFNKELNNCCYLKEQGIPTDILDTHFQKASSSFIKMMALLIH